MTDDRYQHQSFIVRCYRWWRWMPLYFALGFYWWAYALVVWPRGAFDDETRWEFAAQVFSTWKGSAQIRMRWLYDWDEVMGRLKE